jgi:hypothetical protein
MGHLEICILNLIIIYNFPETVYYLFGDGYKLYFTVIPCLATKNDPAPSKVDARKLLCNQQDMRLGSTWFEGFKV